MLTPLGIRDNLRMILRIYCATNNMDEELPIVVQPHRGEIMVTCPKYPCPNKPCRGVTTEFGSKRMTIKIRCQHNAAPTGLFCVSLSYHSYHNVAPMGLKLTPMPGGDLLAASIFRSMLTPYSVGLCCSAFIKYR
jgi:hypothetical protein